MDTTTVLEIILAIIGSGLLVFEPLWFYRVIKKKKAAEATTVDADNSERLIEIQEKYITLIDDKDHEIRKLNEELINTKEELIYYKSTHCVVMDCTSRKPPFIDYYEKKFGEKHNTEDVDESAQK